MESGSRIIEDAVQELSRFPGIGKKTAMRMALYLIRQTSQDVDLLADRLRKLKSGIRFCRECGHLSEVEICSICSGINRKHEQLCIVKDFQDVFAIEQTAQFNGLYHVLGGVISPVDGIGPEDLNLNGLSDRIQRLGIKEVILALSPTVEGEFTSFYVQKKIRPLVEKISAISTGIAVGGELEYADELTLARSLMNRTELR